MTATAVETPRFTVVIDDHVKEQLAHRTKKTALMDEDGHVFGYYYPLEVEAYARQAVLEKMSVPLSDEELRARIKNPGKGISTKEMISHIEAMLEKE